MVKTEREPDSKNAFPLSIFNLFHMFAMNRKTTNITMIKTIIKRIALCVGLLFVVSVVVLCLPFLMIKILIGGIDSIYFVTEKHEVIK